MAFKRIIANSEEDLKTIMNNIKTWFKETNDYKTEFTTEKRKFQDPDTKAIVEKNIDVIKVTDNANDKFSTIKFIPMKEKGEMKVEIGGEGEAAVSGKISNQMKGKGKLKSYSKDKKVALKENPNSTKLSDRPVPTDKELRDEFEKRKPNFMKSIKGQLSGYKIKEEEAPKPKMIDKIKNVFNKKNDNGEFEYKNQTIEMDYEPGSKFANLVNDLENTRLFKGSEDALSDFMSSKIFDKLAQSYNIKFEEPGYSPRKIKLAPEKPSNPSDSIPKQTRDMAARPGATPGATSYSDFDLYELLKKTGKVTVTQLKEIIKEEIRNIQKENFESFDNLESAIKRHEKGDGYYNRTKLITIFNQLEASDQQKARTKYSEYFGKKK